MYKLNIKVLRRKCRRKSCVYGLSNGLLDIIPKEQVKKDGLYKSKSLYALKYIIKKVKRPHPEWGKYIPTSDKGLVSRIHK